MSFPKLDKDYWNNKLAAYFHDPIDKALKIQGHEERAAEILKIFGLQKPNEEFWKIADGIASGFERGQLPSYNSDENKDGSVSFLENPVITHPISMYEEDNSHILKITNIDNGNDFVDKVNKELLEFLEKDIGMSAGKGGYSDEFKGNEEKFSKARFLYSHLALRFKLAEKNIGGLGGFWHRIPADTRFPDHSIWQHNSLTSAINSVMELSKTKNEKDAVNNIGIMVFSITPVQSFISKARKLRDYWTGSILLSYLAFEGIRWIIENLGPDHILYPSLIDQPLITEYMVKNWKVNIEEIEFWKKQRKDIANFPNKFVALIPLNYFDDITKKIESHVKEAWKKLFNISLEFIKDKIDLEENEYNYISEMFKRQSSEFWNIDFAAVKLLSINDKNKFSELLHKSNYENQEKVFEKFFNIVKERYENSEEEIVSKGIFYSTSHSLVQSALASLKVRREVKRKEEPGLKCSLCGEFEVLKTKKYNEGESVEKYKRSIESFWRKLREQFPKEIKENERLCSICFTKRFISRAIRDLNKREHILFKVFEKAESYPTTTEIALTKFFIDNSINEEEKRKIANNLYENELDNLEDNYSRELKNYDKYYAILMMDGDNMGDLINGKTHESRWESIMHPKILEKLKNVNFDKLYKDNWQDIFSLAPKRFITPSVHASISEALGDFAQYYVSPIIEKYKGRLIYAGGDDVCAVLPVGTVFKAAKEIREAYSSVFNVVKFKDNKLQAEAIKNEYSPNTNEKLSISLGKGEKISISAGILICHHKENLSEMILEAHSLLERAKNEFNRNSFLIELKKRSGGSRFFGAKWSDEKRIKSFIELGELNKKNLISTSFVYKLEKLKVGFDAIKQSSINDKEKKIKKLISSQLERSKTENIGDKKREEIALKITNLLYDENNKFNPESLIISNFIAQGGFENE